VRNLEVLGCGGFAGFAGGALWTAGGKGMGDSFWREEECAGQPDLGRALKTGAVGLFLGHNTERDTSNTGG